MNLDDEPLIERCICRPATLSAEERRKVEHLLASDAAARKMADFFRQLYRDLDVLSRAVPPQVERFVEALFAVPRLLPLRPYPSPPRFRTLATLAAPEEGILVRIRCDHERPCGRLSVLSDAPEKRAHALVSFPALPLDVATDRRGQAAFPLPAAPVEWSPAVLRLPVAAFVLSRAGLLPDGAALPLPGAGRLRCTVEGERLTLHTAGAGPALSFAVFEPEAGGHLLLPFEGGRAVLDVSGVPDAFTIRVYG